jgi:hypothetical protein
MKTRQLIALTAISLTLFACDKDEDDVIPTVPSTPSTPTQSAPSTINFGDADGTLIAVNSVSTTLVGTITIGTAIGVFYDNGSLVDVGTVNSEGTDLTKDANNSYTASASILNPMGISFTTPISWMVSGANGFSNFSEDISRDFPTADAVTGSDIVDKSDGYTLSTTRITNSDSVLFSIGTVVKTMPANATSYSFTSAELSGLANGTSFVSIAPYNFSSKSISGKKIYFVNETVVQKMVTVQD